MQNPFAHNILPGSSTIISFQLFAYNATISIIMDAEESIHLLQHSTSGLPWLLYFRSSRIFIQAAVLIALFTVCDLYYLRPS